MKNLDLIIYFSISWDCKQQYFPSTEIGSLTKTANGVGGRVDFVANQKLPPFFVTSPLKENP